MHNKSKYIPYLVIILSTIISPTTVYAERLSAKHLYNFAKNQNEQMLSRYRRWINMADNGGNTALCIALQKDDGKSYYLLKKYGASSNVRCMRQFSEEQTANVAIDSSDDGKFLGMGKLGWGALGVAAIGGGIAAASGGGGGREGGSGDTEIPGTTLQCKHGYQEKDICICDIGYTGTLCNRLKVGYIEDEYGKISCASGYGKNGTDECVKKETSIIGKMNNGTVRIENQNFRDVAGLYSSTSTINLATQKNGFISITNQANGDVFGILGSQNVVNNNAMKSVNGYDVFRTAKIDIYNKGNGNVYGIYALGNASNVQTDAVAVRRGKAANGTGEISITNIGNGNVFGIFAYGEANNAIQIDDQRNVMGSIYISNSGSGVAVGMFAPVVLNQSNSSKQESSIFVSNHNKGLVTGIYARDLAVNSGDITISNSQNGVAIGIYTDNGTVTNSGNVLIDSNGGTSIGIYGAKGSSITNTGTITISGGGTAYGIYSEGSSVKNSGIIKINGDSNSPNAIKLNGGKLFQNGVLEGENLALDEYGGEIVASADSKFVAKNSISGDLSVSDSVVADGFANSYTIKEAIDAADATDLKLNSKSALFEAKLAENNSDIVMEMKDFNEVVTDKSVAGFLSDNYNQQNNEKLFSSLKGIENSQALNQSLEDMTGKEMFNRFAFEDLTMMREFNFDLNNKLFNNQEETLSTSGNISSWMFSGADNSQTKYSLNNITVGKNTVGLAVALTDINSKGNDGNNSRNDRMYQVAMPIGYQAYGFNFITTPSIGYSYGTYNRHGFNNSYYKGTVEKQMFGVMNEARYPFMAAGWNLDIALEFNVLGYHISGDEGSRDYGLNIAEQNTYSAEAGIGLYANKEISLAKDSKLKLYNGIAVYHEFADPYKMKIGMNGMAGTFTLRDENRSANRAIIRTGFDYTKQDLSLYGSLSSYIDQELQTNADLGLKYSF